MALIRCPECGKEVSSTAPACPGCGYVMATAGPPNAAEPLLEVRPSWWAFFWHLVFGWLLVPLVIAFWRRHSFVLRVYPDRVHLERGVMNEEFRDVFIKDVRSIDVDQSVWGRLVDIGNLTISTAAAVDAAELCPGVARPAPDQGFVDPPASAGN